MIPDLKNLDSYGCWTEGISKVLTGEQDLKTEGMIRAADAKEVGVGNPAEETYCHPNQNRFKSYSKPKQNPADVNEVHPK